MIVIVDYGVGNLRSILNMLRKIGADVRCSSDASEIRKADKLILPGVGHFDHGMAMLRAGGFLDALNEAVLADCTPVLGICLGAQIIGRRSQEGAEAGLAWLDMDCVRLPASSNNRVPHMMWNEIHLERPCPLLNERSNDARYYFVHSYYMKCSNLENVVAYTEYGLRFASVVRRGNIIGVQFHPEKSLRHGLQFLKSFHETSVAELRNDN